MRCLPSQKGRLSVTHRCFFPSRIYPHTRSTLRDNRFHRRNWDNYLISLSAAQIGSRREFELGDDYSAFGSYLCSETLGTLLNDIVDVHARYRYWHSVYDRILQAVTRNAFAVTLIQAVTQLR